jgi:hypothetical protein
VSPFQDVSFPQPADYIPDISGDCGVGMTFRYSLLFFTHGAKIAPPLFGATTLSLSAITQAGISSSKTGEYHLGFQFHFHGGYFPDL